MNFPVPGVECSSSVKVVGGEQSDSILSVLKMVTFIFSSKNATGKERGNYVSLLAFHGPAAELPGRLQRPAHRQPARCSERDAADGALPHRGHERAGPDSHHQLRSNHQMARRLPHVGAG